MKRLTVIVLAMTMVTVGVAWAQEEEHQQHHPAQQGELAAADGMMQGGGMMQDGGMMMQMMAAPDVAAWDGNIYVLSGMKLEKFSPDLLLAGTVEFEDPPGMMEGTMGGGMMQQAEGEAGQQGGMMGGGMMGGGMMGPEMMQRMHQMHRARTMANARVAADAQGVYVLRGMTVTVYDHDLNELRSAEVMDMPEDHSRCPMCRQMMERMQQQGGMMGGRMQDGGMAGGNWSDPVERQIANGAVHLFQRPAQARSGQMMFRVHVLGEQHQTDSSASITGFIYPEGRPAAGRTITFAMGPGGHMVGSAQVSAGRHELALRVKRPGMEDAVVYYDVSAQR